ncbi:hypothetical protein MTR_8g079420 [Medicago truncatula]|uniref:Uncharacterized protein n=1 Tax=Medicago truncatula TaxID=3880 RepID=G7LGB0_MEDTR|nr:hypothetical protein MTR_8g079420 [Medicago truncatula]
MYRSTWKLYRLPLEFGNLCNLRNLYVAGCLSCELSFSVANLLNLIVIYNVQ